MSAVVVGGVKGSRQQTGSGRQTDGRKQTDRRLAADSNKTGQKREECLQLWWQRGRFAAIATRDTGTEQAERQETADRQQTDRQAGSRQTIDTHLQLWRQRGEVRRHVWMGHRGDGDISTTVPV
jgi:hypothetical protein